MTNTLNEILPELSREIPLGIQRRYITEGEPLFIAYGCVLLERETDDGYEYKAVNIATDESEVLSRGYMQLTTSGVEEMLEKIRLSSVAGSAGIFDIGDEFPDVTSDYDDDFIKDFMVYKLYDALETLPEHERKFIETLYFSNFGDGISEQEYAFMSGIPATVVADKKQRIIRKLRGLLED